MNIIGISAFYHESACCVLRDGVLIAAAEEERFSRLKHDPRLPMHAFRFCLQAAGLSITDIDCVAYYESPSKRLSRQLWAGGIKEGRLTSAWSDPTRVEREIREILGYAGPIDLFTHHQSHAASSFFYSGFSEAAILSVDAVGEWATTTYGIGRESAIDMFEEVEFPHSLGLLYSTITAFLGFSVNSGEYKVMGLAPYGEPRYLDQMWTLITSGSDGQYQLNMPYFDFVNGERMYSEQLCKLFDFPPRLPESEIRREHADLAKSVQIVLEEVLLEKVRYLHAQTTVDSLCLAGGVALNCVANSGLLKRGPFKRLFVQPAGGDSGGCLGAAALAHVKHTGKRHTTAPLRHVFLGPRFNSPSIAYLLAAMEIPALDFQGRTDALLEAVTDRLIAGKVVGWFHGPMEFGPRALGARSILGDPRDPNMRNRINALVKKRESFRPFSPSVLIKYAAEHFDLDHPSPFMLETCQVKSLLDLPAVTHIDRSARVQTVDPHDGPRYAALLDAFYQRTGCPVLLNTSFNVRDEPIVCTPDDAILCTIRSGLDSLVLEDFIIDRDMLPEAWKTMFAEQPIDQPSVQTHNIYTFV